MFSQTLVKQKMIVEKTSFQNFVHHVLIKTYENNTISGGFMRIFLLIPLITAAGSNTGPEGTTAAVTLQGQARAPNGNLHHCYCLIL